MKTALATLRLTLDLGWVYPLVIALGQFIGVLHGILPLYLYVVAALAAVALLRLVAASNFSPARHRRFYVGAALVFALAMTLVVQLVSIAAGLAPGVWTAGVNLALLAAIVLRGMAVSTEDTTYQDVLSSFRTGILMIVVTVLFVYGAQGLRFANAQPAMYPAVVGYVLMGVCGLAFARRYAGDLYSKDLRVAGAEVEWIGPVILVVGIIGIVGLALIQLFSFDLVGALGNLTAPLQVAIAAVLRAIVTGIFGFFVWLFHTVGLNHIASRPHLRPPGAPSKHPIGFHKRLHHGPRPLVLVIILKVLGIMLIGGLLVTLALLALRAVSFGRRTVTLKGESRISSWSWRRVFNWLFRRGKDELAALMPHPTFGRPRAHRINTVRDAYRALLRHGRQHARPRAPGETGLEYTAELAQRWTGTAGPLDHLNSLYMAVRYGSRPDAPGSDVQAAIDDLRSVTDHVS